MSHECLNCSNPAMEYGKRDVAIVRDGMKSVVKNILGWHCAACSEIEFAKGQAKRYNDALQALKAKVIDRDAQDLARIRKKLKLTQQQAAVLTGGGKNAFSRYENGQAKPMAAVVNLFRLLERNPKLMKDLSLL